MKGYLHTDSHTQKSTANIALNRKAKCFLFKTGSKAGLSHLTTSIPYCTEDCSQYRTTGKRKGKV